LSLLSLAPELRLTPLRLIGSGGYGDVWEVHDQSRDAVVALKLLKHEDATSILYLKDEFRALAALSHPNLVRLYELHVGAEHRFITMERVHGCSIVEYVRGRGGESAAAVSATRSLDLPPLSRSEDLASGSDVAEPISRRASALRSTAAVNVFDEHRLRSTARQLAEAIAYLHARGKLHRDLKPSNVLVRESGQVVVLDFGLVAELATLGGRPAEALGTPQYMAPETVAGEVSAQSDWYSFGVILFEMLTGTVPWRGDNTAVLLEKRRRDAPNPADVAAQLPDDLAGLCSKLLARVPGERPSADDVLASLGARTDEPAPVQMPLIGRSGELAILEQAFEASQQRRTVLATVRGRSGMGKTSLAGEFVKALEARQPRPLILTGRCHPEETLPYKALDAVMDALSRHLSGLAEREVAELRPKQAQALCRAFPVLSRVRGLAEGGDPPDDVDPVEQRLRAFDAARELLNRLAATRPLVLLIDDLQWGDDESAALIRHLLSAGVPYLLLLFWRAEEERDSAFLRTFLRDLAELRDLERHDLALGPLAESAAIDVALSYFRHRSDEVLAQARRIARESRGQPLFVAELAHHAARGGALPEEEHADELSVAALIRARAPLVADARALAEIVALAFRPLPMGLLERMAGPSTDWRGHWHDLETGRWVRVRRLPLEAVVEPYHDQVREALTTRLGAERRAALHERIASVLEERGVGPPDLLAGHFAAAGVKAKACEYSLEAARLAVEHFAFEHAVQLYKLALEQISPADRRRSEILEALGDVLSLAGQRDQAAEAFLSAVPGADEHRTLDLRRRAAAELIMTGKIDAGLDIIRSVLGHLKIAYPERLATAGLGFLWFSLLAWWRERKTADSLRPPTEHEALELDGLHVVTFILGLAEPIRGMLLCRRRLALALTVDDPARVARALANELPYTAFRGGESPSEREQALHARARALAAKSADPEVMGLVDVTAGVAALLRGRWDATLEHFGAAEQVFRAKKSATWERNVIHVFTLYVLRYRGEWAQHVARLTEQLADARARADLYTEVQLLTNGGDIQELLADDPATAEKQVGDALRRWGRPHFDQQRAQGTFVLGWVHLYADAGRGDRGWQFVLDTRADFARSGAVLVPTNRVAWHDLRMRGALARAACARTTAERDEYLAHARRDATRLSRDRLRFAAACGELGFGCAAAIEGNAEEAARRLTVAVERLAAVRMKLHVAAAEWRREQVQSQSSGSPAALRAEQVARDEGSRNPRRLLASLAPG
jgi:eukaryotic-like serine/threonine-protein kinase